MAAAGPRAEEWLAAPGAAEGLAGLCAQGAAPSAALARDPGALAFALAGPARPPLGDVTARLGAAAATLAEPLALHRARRREVLRILHADVVGGAALETVAGAISDLADSTVRAVLDRERAAAVARDGPPLHGDGSPAALTCIALGKLGGGELNYSSDVDLLFLRSGEGATAGADGAPGTGLHEHFSGVAAAVTRALSRPTAEGHLYRVDLRLRPRGSAGGIAPRVESAVHYYRSQGRGWERQALLKARVVAGDGELGARFLAEIEPWVFGRPLLSAEIAEIRRLKREMERASSGGAADLKSAPGGIRDVEYVVQFLQLLLGAAHPEVRAAGTMEALRRLERAAALRREEARSLRDAYVFLRTAEHRLQAADDVQTHTLPPEEAALRRLARRMGLGGDGGDPLERFRREHARHSAAARAALDGILLEAFSVEGRRAADVVDLLLGGTAPTDDALRGVLEPFGFRDPGAAWRDLRRMADASSPWLPRTRTYFASAAPALLARAAETPAPDRALALVQTLSERAAGSGLFFRLLTENPDVLGVFCDLGGGSPYLSRLLAARPATMDAFLDALVVAPRDGLPPFEDLPLGAIEQSEDPSAALHDLRDLELLRIGVRDLQGKDNARQTARALTAAAESAVRLADGAAAARLDRMHGSPPGARFAVLALGRLGAGEMAYGSDLDLLFLSEGDAPAPDGTDATTWFARRARDLVAILGGAGDRGPVYRLDLRLRPEGARGPLVASLGGFLRYLRERAETWERQALVRARAVAGDGELCARAMAGIADVLWGAPPPEGLLAEVRAMRARTEAAATPGSLKTSRGGLQEVEFLVQALTLQHGHAHPDVRQANTVAALGALRRDGLLSAAAHEGLTTCYLFLRAVEMRLRLASDATGSVFPADPAARDDLARRLGYVATAFASPGVSLAEEVDYYRGRIRTWWDRIMGGAPS